MKKFFYFFIFLSIGCFAQPGKDGAFSVSALNQILNHYVPVSANITAGSNLVTIANPTLFPVCPGDLIMIYQAQGAGMTTPNNNTYGTITAYNSAGLYEFAYVQNINGNIITTQTTFTNSYSVAGNVQLIKVPQYTTLTINAGGSVIPKLWKDTVINAVAYRFGGLVVLHATTIVNNGIIKATGSGFRGGQTNNNSFYQNGHSHYVSSNMGFGGEKGESISGFQIDYDNNGGRYCRGAPANGGGGGTTTNAGGGGGANGNSGNTWTGQGIMVVNSVNPLAAWSLDPAYAANGNALTLSSGGGRGGYSWGDGNGNAIIQGPGNPAWLGDTRREIGGIGGRPLININAETRIYFGGGGGAGHTNNNASPSASDGGGIVYLIATTGITGNGIIEANGTNAGNSSGCHCDGASGAGAGGSIIVKTMAISSQNIQANGGTGGNQLALVPPGGYYENEGPGGGGGGGFVAVSSGALIPSVNGGLNGTTLSNSVAGEMTFNGATKGADGHVAPVSTNFISFTPISQTLFSASNNGPVCAGSPLILTTTVSALSYTWAGPNNSSSSTQSYTINNVTAAASGIYTLQLNTGNCLVAGSATTQVIVNSLPTVSVLGSTVCSGQSINLNPIVSSATAYAWAGPNNFTASTQNISIPNTMVNATGNYSLTITNSAGCTASAVANVSVTPTPTPVLLSNAPLCQGSALTFTTSGATSYTLTGPNAFSSTVQNPTITNVTSAASGIYTLAATNSTCSANALLNVVINTAPVAVAGASTTQLCQGQTLNLNSSGGVSYSWFGPSSFTSNVQNPVINSSSVNNSSSYTVTVTAAGGCTASAVSPFITVSPTPTLSVLGASVCINQPINITANSQGSTFSWTGPNGFSSAAQTINFSSASLNLSGSYNLTVTSNQGCTNTAAAIVSVAPLPSPTLSSNSPVCVGGLLNFTGGGGISYLYSGPNGFSSTLQNPNINNITHAASGIYTLTVTNFGCSAFVTSTVSVFGSGAGTLTTNANEKCVPFCPTFSVNTNDAPIVNTTLTVNGQFFTGNSVNYCITNPGNYTISSSFKDGDGCLNTSTITVTGYPKPQADFIFSPLKPIENTDEVVFTNTSSGVNQTSWNWFFINNNGFTSSNQNTFYLFENAGIYPVALVVSNVWGCADTIVKPIIIGNDYSLYVPNAFTPDGDGLNDVFLPKGVGVTKYQMQIFDRWGEILFSSKDFYTGWDGTFKGLPCKTDTYTWKINVSDPEGRVREYTGHVTLYK